MRIDQLPFASSVTNGNTLPVNVSGTTEQVTIGNLVNSIRDDVYGAPLTAATAAAMTDQTKIYVYTGTTGGGFTNGHWYYYNGTAWTDGGVYNSAAVQTDTTLSLSGVPADAKAVGDAINATNANVNANAAAIEENAGNIAANTTRVSADEAAIAPTFSASTAYAAGAYVWYNGNLYRFTAAHAAGAWTGTDAAQVALAGDVADLKSAINSLYTGVPLELVANSYWLATGYPGYYNGWSRTKRIPCTPGEILKIGTTVASGYNDFFSTDNDGAVISTFAVASGSNEIVVPNNAYYVALSNTTAAMNSTTISRLLNAQQTANSIQQNTEAIQENTEAIQENAEAIQECGSGRYLVETAIDWQYGFIDNNGNIDSTVTSYSYSQKISSEELNGAKIKGLEINLYAFRYNKDGTSIYGYKTITAGDSVTIPDNFFEANVDVRLEIITPKRASVVLYTVHKTGVQQQIDELKPIGLEVPKVVMLDKLVALQGEEFDVHYDNILVNYNAKDIPYKELFGNVHGIGMEEFARLLNENAELGVTGAIRYRMSIPSAFNSPSLPDDVLKKSFAVDTIPTSAGSGVTRKVLLIGDSWTAPGKYARELRTLFESADEPMNITLLGTLGNGGAYVGPENGYHEGHGAYSAKTYCTKSTYNGYANAFYNPTTETFDFTYYMNNCGYSSVDDVFINLGINDVAETADFDEIISYWDIMINSIKAYNSNINVFIGLCGLPAQYKYGTTNNNCDRSKARRLLFHERLISEYGNMESDGLIIVPLHLSIDPKHDFPTEQRARSYRDATLVDYCTDYVHPSDIAYNKIADRIRTYIKYAETLN